MKGTVRVSALCAVSGLTLLSSPNVLQQQRLVLYVMLLKRGIKLSMHMAVEMTCNAL